jgi:hypothetical protein
MLIVSYATPAAFCGEDIPEFWDFVGSIELPPTCQWRLLTFWLGYDALEGDVP